MAHVGRNWSSPGACRGCPSPWTPSAVLCLMVTWKLGLSSSHSHFLVFNYFEAFDAAVRSACELHLVCSILSSRETNVG